MKRWLIPVAAALLLALPASSSAATTSIKIVPGAFSPAKVTISAGDTVQWTNTTAANHQVVSDDGNFASGTIKPDGSYSFTFKSAGTYAYHDGLHPALRGTVTVNGPPPEVTLAAGSPVITYGGSTLVSGKVSSGDSGDAVIITSRPNGAPTVQQVGVVTTGAGGSFSTTVKPRIETTYTATWKGATSQSVTVQVRPQLTLGHLSTTRLFAKVSSSISYSGHFVYLQRRTSVGWITVKRLLLGPQSGRVFKAPHVRGVRIYRVYLSPDQAGDGYVESSSNAVRVRYRR
jgi:plastocyanin